VQGVFQSRPFSFDAINPGAVQKKPSVQHQSGVDAFQVDLRPKSGGWPLPRDVQAKMEAALGASFSDVRIHVGPEASAIGAIAFTWGSDLHFAPGQYNPHTPPGQFLLAHELTHVVQQRAGRVANPFGSGVAVVQDHALEAEADRLGRLAASSRPPEPASFADSSTGSRSGVGRVGTTTINMKPQAASYAVRAPRPNGSGWEISVAAQGMQHPVGSLQMAPSEKGVLISNLKVAPEHRRHGLAGQLIDAAVRSARNRGYPVAQLEARPDSAADVTPGALFSMYQRYGFRMTGRSHRGNPLMERTT
jgi:GNAT superfamily N-acetyltransferase